MNIIEIYDPALCCSTGVCGPTPDNELAAFASTVEELKQTGIVVNRHNLAQEPLAFAQNAEVKTILETESDSALPLIFINGKLHVRGFYPSKEQLTKLLEPAAQTAVSPSFVKVEAPKNSPSQASCCDPSTGCC